MQEKENVFVRALLLILILTLLCGIVYPLMMTGISQLLFKEKANGSIIEVDHVKYGSSLIGQKFTDEKYFWSRPTEDNLATFYDKKGTPLYYAGPSNMSPASDEYGQTISLRAANLQEANPEQNGNEIPVDLVTGSASGLDPNISVAAARYQTPRVAEARNLKRSEVQEIVDKYTTKKALGIFGEPAVNVLLVNLALDGAIG